MSLLNLLPLFLIYSRLVFGVTILLLAWMNGRDATSWIIALILAGLLSDVLDGIIARKLGISSITLRKLDSIVDRIFWLMVLSACGVLYQDYLYSKIGLVAFVLALEISVFALCLLRFSRIPSPHNFLSKAWGLLIALTMIDIMLNGSSLFLFNGMIALGVVSRVDSLLIHLLLKKGITIYPVFIMPTLSG